MSQPDIEDLVLLDEIDETDDPLIEAQLPADAPPVRTIDDVDYVPVYSKEPLVITKIPLDRWKYASREIAEERARELCRKRGLKFKAMFETARYYVAECVEHPFKVVP